LRRADCITQYPLSGVTRKTFAHAEFFRRWTHNGSLVAILSCDLGHRVGVGFLPVDRLAALADASWAVYYVAVLAFLLRNQYVIGIRLAAGLFEYAYGPFPKDIDQLNGIA
jgi:hypothetical protein